MNGQTDSITPESSATDLIGNAPSGNGVRPNSNGNSAANGTAAETQDGLMSGKTSTVTGKIQEMKDFMFVVVSDDGHPTHSPMIPISDRTGSTRSNPATA